MKRDEILQARDRLTQALGHPPTMSDIGRAVGCSREYVRKVYVANSLPTSEHAHAMRATNIAHKAKREQTHAAIVARNREIAAELHAGATIAAAAQAHGVSPTIAARVRIAAGLPERRRLFSPEEDAIVMREAPRLAAEQTGRTIGVIYSHRRFLRARQNV